jgi:hypothetical protein
MGPKMADESGVSLELSGGEAMLIWTQDDLRKKVDRKIGRLIGQIEDCRFSWLIIGGQSSRRGWKGICCVYQFCFFSTIESHDLNGQVLRWMSLCTSLGILLAEPIMARRSITCFALTYLLRPAYFTLVGPVTFFSCRSVHLIGVQVVWEADLAPRLDRRRLQEPSWMTES